MLESYRDLTVWRRSTQMSLAIYRLTTEFPKAELVGHTNQVRRPSVSVPSNIAEGYGRYSTGEYKQFLGMARGSNLEVQTQLYLATEPGFGDCFQLKKAEGLSIEVEKMLNSLIAKL